MSLKRYCASLLGAVLLFCACASPQAVSDPAPTEQPHGTPSTGKIAFELIGKDGNDMIYDKSHVTPDPSSPLSGKTVYWLGSSVTYGAGSNGQSMAHFMAVKDGVTSVVEAMSGTTLMTGETKPETSYVNRLLSSEKFDKGYYYLFPGVDYDVVGFGDQHTTIEGFRQILAERGIKETKLRGAYQRQ